MCNFLTGNCCKLRAKQSQFAFLRFQNLVNLKNFCNMVEGFESGLAYYRQQDWGRAEEAFTQTLGGFQNNLASELYLERIRLYRKSPPSSDWDGVFVATEKYGDDEQYPEFIRGEYVKNYLETLTYVMLYQRTL